MQLDKEAKIVMTHASPYDANKEHMSLEHKIAHLQKQMLQSWKQEVRNLS
jgi:cell division protein FtsL